MSIFSKLLANTGVIERRRGDRLSAEALGLSYWSGKKQHKAKAKDISDTGIYVITEERWMPGAEVSLTLESKSHLIGSSRSSVQLIARVVRQGDDGVGFTFLQNDLETNLWSTAISMAAGLTAPGDAVGRLRAAKALAFLAHISPSIEIEFANNTMGSMNPHAWERLIDFALTVERRVQEQEQPIRNNVSSGLIFYLLEGASKADGAKAKSFWLGLSTNSYLLGADDDEILRFASLMSGLDSVHFDIFSAACEMAMQAEFGPEEKESTSHYCTADEIRRITRMRNLVAIERHLHHLEDLGLLQPTGKPLGCEQIDRANMTPTSLGLKLFASCNGPQKPAHMLGYPELKIAV